MKALIITSNRYPRSGAASNYIQYFASMLKLGGYDVTVAGVRLGRRADYAVIKGMITISQL